MAASSDSVAGLAGQTVLAIFAHPDDESLACGGTLARLADAGARVVLFCATRGERGGPTGPVRDDALALVRVQELRCAAAALGISDVILMDHPDGELRLGAGRRVPGANCRRRPPLRAVRRHHLRRRWPVLASRSHRRLRAHHHGPALARRRGAAALPRHHAARYHTAALRGRAVARMGAAAEGILEPGPGCLRPPRSTRRRSLSTSSRGSRRRWRRFCATRRRWESGHPFDQLEPAEAERWLGTEHFHRVAGDVSQPAVLELIGCLTHAV